MSSIATLQTLGVHPRKTNRNLCKQLQQLVALEYGLMDACHESARSASENDLALYAEWAGSTQVHLFDLGTALRELGDDAPSYSRCIRHALLQSGDHQAAGARIERAYVRLLDRMDMHEGLRTLLRANLNEHRGYMLGTRNVAWAA